jgi:hypothetical protein
MNASSKTVSEPVRKQDIQRHIRRNAHARWSEACYGLGRCNLLSAELLRRAVERKKSIRSSQIPYREL